ncbi:hypothetical protein C4D60_Mb04t07370 [Musa balbisiana]|uniref:Uncharacterized protein n=1 Tax=Musa balbisiana TaxID=52838 RepID=A0A4S8KAD3_MUSBA|nr:hypothetical protein C4D60_Mb04t07370 [Musa balbisiana]
MVRGGIVVEATTSSSTEPLLHSRALYTRSLSRFDDELRSFQSYLSGLLVPLPPPGHLRPHRLRLHPLLCPSLSCLRRDGLTLPHLCLWPLLPLSFRLHLSLRRGEQAGSGGLYGLAQSLLLLALHLCDVMLHGGGGGQHHSGRHGGMRLGVDE